LSSWLERLQVVAAASDEDASAVARDAIEREIVKREKKLGTTTAVQDKRK
jgi:predicted transcriptional regulator